MAEVLVRRFQDGRMVSDSTTHSVVDIFFNDSLKNIQWKDKKDIQDQTCVCVHWDDTHGTSTSIITITQPDWEGEHSIDKELCLSLMHNRSPLHTFLADLYNNLGAKLSAVKICPLVFIFIHSPDNLLIKNGSIFMTKLNQLVSKCVSADPKVKVKIKVHKHTEDTCVSLHHDFNQDETNSGFLRFADANLNKPADVRSDLSADQRFAMIDAEMSRLKSLTEMKFCHQRQENDRIFAAVEQLLKIVHSGKTVPGDSGASSSENVTVLENVINNIGNIVTQGEEYTLSVEESSEGYSQERNCDTFLLTEDEEQTPFQGESSSSLSRSGEINKVKSQIPDRVDALRSGLSESMSFISSEKAVSERTEAERPIVEPDSTVCSRHPQKTMPVGDTGNEVNETVTNVNESNVMAWVDTTRRPNSPDRKMPMERAHSNSDIHDGLSAGSKRATETTLLPELARETEQAETGIRISSLRPLMQGLCELHPDQERIWIEVDKKLTNDKDKFPRAGNALDTILCLDTSESISTQALTEMKAIVSNFINGLGRISRGFHQTWRPPFGKENALKGIEEIAETYDVEENIGLVTFGGMPKVLHIATNDYGSLRDSLETITCGGKSPLLLGSMVALSCLTTGTNCNDGGLHVLQRIIFITDGVASATFDEDGRDIVVSNSEQRLQMVSAFGAMGKEYGEREMINFVWIPIGNADRNLLKSFGELSKGRFLEGNQVYQLCKFQLFRKTAMYVLTTLQGGKEEEIDSTRLEDMISAYAPGLAEEEKDEIKKLVLDKLFSSDNTNSHDIDDFDNINIERGLPALGCRVIRGLDWKWDDQDSGGPGTIVNHVNGGGSVIVLWDNEHSNQYRYGAEGCFDVLIDDGCIRPFQDGQRPEIGVQVERGPDWMESYGVQDGGPGNYGVIIRIRGRRVKVRWENGNIYEYRFGEDDRYDLIMRDAADCLMSKTAHKSNERNRQQTESSLTASVESNDGESYVWQRFEESQGWQNYSKAENEKLTKEFVKKKMSCLVSRNGISYRVCFRSELERCLDNGNTSRIRRVKTEQ